MSQLLPPRVAICGLAGVGKGSVVPLVAKYFGVMSLCVGDVTRDITSKRGIPKDKMEQSLLENPVLDGEIDQCIVSFVSGNKQKGFVLEGRRVRHLVPEIPSVLMRCDDLVRIARIAERKRISEEEALRETMQREKTTSNRYILRYGMSLREMLDPTLFTCAIDTTDLTISDVVGLVCEVVERHRHK